MQGKFELSAQKQATSILYLRQHIYEQDMCNNTEKKKTSMTSIYFYWMRLLLNNVNINVFDLFILLYCYRNYDAHSEKL